MSYRFIMMQEPSFSGITPSRITSDWGDTPEDARNSLMSEYFIYALPAGYRVESWSIRYSYMDGLDTIYETFNIPESIMHDIGAYDIAAAIISRGRTLPINISVYISANTVLASYILTYTAGVGGALSGEALQTVAPGADGTPVTAIPNYGYIFVNWSDGSTANPRTDTNVTTNKSVKANFGLSSSPVGFTLQYYADPGGTLSGNTSQIVALGADGTPVTAVPNSGYIFSSWSDGSTDNPRTDTNVTADNTVRAYFSVSASPATHTLHYTAGSGGTLSGSTAQTVLHGADGTPVTAVPNSGYIFISWSNGSTANPRTDTNVTTDISVTAYFSLPISPTTHILHYTAGSGGTISGITTQTVLNGANGTPVMAVPNDGYTFSSWSDGSTANPRTDTNVTTDISVTSYFTASYTPSAYYFRIYSQSAGVSPTHLRSESCSSPALAAASYGPSDIFTYTPEPGYHVSAWAVSYEYFNGTSILGNFFTLADIGNYVRAVDIATRIVNAGHNLMFAIDVIVQVLVQRDAPSKFLRYYAGPNGTLTGDSVQEVEVGDDGTSVTAVPNEHYTFSQWSDASVDNPRTDTNITTDISVTAIFIPGTYTLTYTAESNGSIEGTTPQSVEYGNNGTPIFALPDAGYAFSQWSDGNTDNPRQDLNVSANISVTASFVVSSDDYEIEGETDIDSAEITGAGHATIADANGEFTLATCSGSQNIYATKDGYTFDPEYYTINVSENIRRWSYTFDGEIWCSQKLSDGSVVIGGAFTEINGISRKCLAHFSAEGDLLDDLDFTFGVTLSNPYVACLYYDEPNELLYIGGYFDVLDVNGFTRDYCACVDLTYNYVDTSFVPDPNSTVRSITKATYAPSTDRIIIGGWFTQINGANACLYLASLDPITGVYDAGFQQVNNVVYVVKNISNTLYIGGNFTTNSSNLAKQNLTTGVWTWFTFRNGAGGPDHQIRDITQASIGASTYTLIGGKFTELVDSVTTHSRSNLALVDLSGAGLVVAVVIDVTGTGSIVYKITDDPDTRIGGVFTAVNGVARNNAARINLNNTTPEHGTYLWAYNPDVTGAAVYTCCELIDSEGVPRDARILLGGDFTEVGGLNRNNLAVTHTGTLIYNGLRFVPTLNNYSVDYTNSDGHVTIGGSASQSVDHGNDATAITITPDANYQLLAWSDDYPISDITGDSRHDTTITHDINADIAAEDKEYVVWFQSGLYCSVTNGGIHLVSHGQDSVIATVVPNRYYVFTTWSDGNTDNPRQEISVTADTIVYPICALDDTHFYDLIYTTDENGLILGDSEQEVYQYEDGSSVFVIPKSQAYMFEKWSDDLTDNPRVDQQVTSDITVEASFIEATYNIFGNAEISDAAITLSTGQSATTNAQGYFLIEDVPYGEVSIRPSKLGYIFTPRNSTLNLYKNYIGLNIEVNGSVNAIAMQNTGQTLLAGLFTDVEGFSKRNLARITESDTLDFLFNPVFAGECKSFIVQDDGKIIVVGDFTGVSGYDYAGIVRLETNGTPDLTFNKVILNGECTCVDIQSDGKIVIGGSFTVVNATAHDYIARLNSDGSLDTTFTISLDAECNSIAVKDNDDIIIGGDFTTVDAVSHAYIAKIEAIGTLDPFFLTALDAPCEKVILQSSTRIILIGSFTTINGQAQSYIGRVNDNGIFDSTFDLEVNGAVNDVAISTVDTSLYIGGSFTTANGESYPYLIHCDVSGDLDTTFAPGLDGAVSVVATYGDDILINSASTVVDGQTVSNTVRLTDTGLLDGGAFFEVQSFGGSGYLKIRCVEHDDAEAEEEVPDDEEPRLSGRWRLAGEESFDREFGTYYEVTAGEVTIECSDVTGYVTPVIEHIDVVTPDTYQTCDVEYTVKNSTISGQIRTTEDVGIPGVDIFDVSGDDAVYLTTTDASGNYSINIDYTDTLVLRPSYASYQFHPEERTFTEVTEDQENQDHIGEEGITELTYTLTLESGGGGSVTGAGTYTAGTEITITALPDTGYAFSEWRHVSSGVQYSTNASETFNLNYNMSLQAIFTGAVYEIAASVGAGGILTCDATQDISYMAQATVSCVANEGYTFTGWYEGEVRKSMQRTYTFPVTRDCELEARFVLTDDLPSETQEVCGLMTLELGVDELATVGTGIALNLLRTNDTDGYPINQDYLALTHEHIATQQGLFGSPTSQTVHIAFGDAVEITDLESTNLAAINATVANLDATEAEITELSVTNITVSGIATMLIGSSSYMDSVFATGYVHVGNHTDYHKRIGAMRYTGALVTEIIEVDGTTVTLADEYEDLTGAILILRAGETEYTVQSGTGDTFVLNATAIVGECVILIEGDWEGWNGSEWVSFTSSSSGVGLPTPSAANNLLLSTDDDWTQVAASTLGSGVIEISNIEDLQKIGNDPGYPLSGDYILTQDIDATDTATWNGGDGFEPIGSNVNPFTGTFDGRGYLIYGLTINRPTEDFVGLFGYIAYITWPATGFVRNVHVSGNITGKDNVGAVIAADAIGGVITNCSFSGTITGNDTVGGVVGGSTGLISKCKSKGTVISSDSAGGIICTGGAEYCYSEANVSGVDGVGGVIGNGQGSSNYCYSVGTVIGNDYVGGVMGKASSSLDQSNLYFAGSVSGSTNVGALLGGSVTAPTVSTSHFLDTSGPDNGYGSPQTIDEMYLEATYTSWDFVNTWKILNGIAFPKLLWQDDDIELDLNGAVIFGDRNTDGSWCIKRDEGDLVYAKRISGVWTIADTIVSPGT